MNTVNRFQILFRKAGSAAGFFRFIPCSLGIDDVEATPSSLHILPTAQREYDEDVASTIPYRLFLPAGGA